jgi:uncharacterized membrane protein YfcA
MYFPASGVDAPVWLPPLVALVISFFASMGGVSGAFLLLPFQVSFLGYTAPSVSATNQLFNVVAIPSGVYRYIREGRMIWPLTLAIVTGTLPGVFIGAWIRIVYLPDPGHFKLFTGLVLLYIGVRLLLDVVRKRGRSGIEKVPNGSFVVKMKTRLSIKRIEFEFAGETLSFSPASVLVLAFAVGIVGGIYGIGGGAIIAPVLVAFLAIPVYAVAGAALMGTLITSVAGLGFYQLLALRYTGQNVAPDWPLGLLFGAGGFVGMYLGARCQRHVPSRAIELLLCSCVLFVALRYVVGFFSG